MTEKKPGWVQGIEIFGEISAWVAIPIIAALAGGKALDSHFGTKPWIFLGLTIIAFAVSILGIWKSLKKYIKEIETNGGTDATN
ncbi:MAG: AtpZ/AtpI family protein [Patescibacteria group bacterium]